MFLYEGKFPGANTPQNQHFEPKLMKVWFRSYSFSFRANFQVICRASQFPLIKPARLQICRAEVPAPIVEVPDLNTRRSSFDPREMPT